MSLISSILVAVLCGAGVYLMLKKRAVDIVLGFTLLSNGVNIVILSSRPWREGMKPPLLIEKSLDQKTAFADPSVYTDPLPQALILTAIVIGFGLISYLIVLASRNKQSDQEDEITGT